MKVKFVFEDWKKIGEPESIANSPLGADLSARDLHSGSVFYACIAFFNPDTEDEIDEAFKLYEAYPVFRMIPCIEEDCF